MRITQQMMTSGTLSRLQERLSTFETTQVKVGTGKRMQVPSDDVAGMSSALRLRSEMAARVQEARNAEDGLMWVNLADSELQGIVAQLQRARELAVRGASMTDVNERAAIQVEIEGIRDDIVAAANSSSQGRPLFAGFAAGDAVAQVGGIWTYQGDTGRVTRRASETDIIAVNVTGDQVFGFAAGQDVFTVLDDMSTALIAGDQAAISGSITAIDDSMGRVLDGLAVLGAAGNRLDAAYERSQVEQNTVRGYLSEVEDVDIAEAISELQMQEVAYQATLGALSKALQPSLIDFLR